MKMIAHSEGRVISDVSGMNDATGKTFPCVLTVMRSINNSLSYLSIISYVKGLRAIEMPHGKFP
jgi:hypothetical protein